MKIIYKIVFIYFFDNIIKHIIFYFFTCYNVQETMTIRLWSVVL